MVGLVIVSHSRALADALTGLLRQVAPPNLPLAVAAGAGENRREFGTDSVEVMEAIRSVYSEDGVLVLMDLGSAVLSANMALELLPPEMVPHIRFCGAPLVEGAIAAAVQIGLNHDLETVYNEAISALLPKREQLGESDDATHLPQLASDQPGASLTLTLTNPHGLHARPVAKFVQTAARFSAAISVRNLTNAKGPVSAGSFNALMTLGAVQNHQIHLEAFGQDAQQALSALKTLVNDNFGEASEAPPSASGAPQAQPAVMKGDKLQAVPVSEGFALAPLFKYQVQRPPVPGHTIEDAPAEWARLQTALQIASHEIAASAQSMKQTLGAGESAIFEAHGLILQDADLLEKARTGIFERHENAALAWHTAIGLIADGYRALDDAYLQTRALDVEDVGAQVLLALMGKNSPAPVNFEQPVILFAADLSPTETSKLDLQKVLGIITASGGPTSHSAILARALGIPAVAGVGAALDRQTNGALTGLDGLTGEIWLRPSAEAQASLAHSRAAWLSAREQLLQTSQQPAITRDGQRVEVFANIGSLYDAQAAVQNGAEGVGLLRTEFMFLTRETAPSEAEQYLLLREIFETLGEKRPVTVRTLDVGGDKALPYLPMPPEANPFLGVRALRLSFARPNLFLTQIRAILRAAQGLPCRIMFPMVADIEEVRKARSLVEEAHQALSAENQPHAWPVELGIMVEIPSAALLSPALAQQVDFFSIGTNDLTQYTLAAERGNPALAHLADGLHPAVLKLIQTVSAAAHQAGKWSAVCGELGGDPQAAAILIGLGVDELSLNPASIPQIKATLRSLSSEAARELAQQALACQTSAEVRQLARAFTG